MLPSQVRLAGVCKAVGSQRCWCGLMQHTDHMTAAAQRAKIAEKVHKPPLGINVINFEFNGFHAFILVPWSPLDTKESYALIKVFKFI